MDRVILAALRGANDALNQNATHPADVELARQIIRGALFSLGETGYLVQGIEVSEVPHIEGKDVS